MPSMSRRRCVILMETPPPGPHACSRLGTVWGWGQDSRRGQESCHWAREEGALRPQGEVVRTMKQARLR